MLDIDAVQGRIAAVWHQYFMCVVNKGPFWSKGIVSGLQALQGAGDKVPCDKNHQF